MRSYLEAQNIQNPEKKSRVAVVVPIETKDSPNISGT